MNITDVHDGSTHQLTRDAFETMNRDNSIYISRIPREVESLVHQGSWNVYIILSKRNTK